LKTHENPNGRKRGLNQDRGVLPRRKNLTNKVKILTNDDDGQTASGNGEELTNNAPEQVDVTSSVSETPAPPNYSAVEVQEIVDNVVEDVPYYETCVLSLVNY